ncbi:MAG: FtsX-like permease family protein [Bacteroidota bacterium]
MKFALQVARRYLFGKKSTAAINIITGISVAGIAIGSAALILILSVFNGFEGLMMQYLDRFNPDLKLVPVEGKFFTPESTLDSILLDVDGIDETSRVIEEVALFEYNDRQQIGIVKGVDQNYINTTDLADVIDEGSFDIRHGQLPHTAVVGHGIHNNLNISLRNEVLSLKVFLPNRKKRGVLDKDFRSRSLQPKGVFRINNERDNQYVLTDYDLVAGLLALSGQISAVEIDLNESAAEGQIKAELISQLGDEYQILDRYEQDESFLKIMNIEKWSSYLIFTFTLLLIIFNVIGCLWMIVLDKRKDISVLQSLGATKEMVRQIFVWEGVLISWLGFGLGLFFAIIFYVLQKQVGIITVPDGYSITAYPMELEIVDVGIIFITVATLGLLASLPAAWRAGRITAFVRVE